MKRLLVTGASGFLGGHICERAKLQWSVWGTMYSHRVRIPGITLLKTDLTHFKDLKILFREVSPDAVIHTAALSSPNFCQEHPQASYQANTLAAVNVAGLCQDRGIPCLFTSSDLIFDGRHPPYAEQDAPSPLSRYGEHKLMAEAGMQQRCETVVICRMPLMFGPAGPASSSFLQPLLEKMKKGKPVALFVDEFRTPLSGKNAAQGVMLALEKLPKLLHLGGAERISRYRFGKRVRDIFNYPNAKLNPCRQKDIPMAAPRPGDVSLTSSQAQKMGFNPDPIETSLAQLKEEMDTM